MKPKRIRRRMDWSGNIIEEVEKPTKGETDVSDVTVTDEFEQHMANIELDEGDAGDTNKTACHFDSDDIYTCPNFFPADGDGEEYDKDIIECRVCGRYTWRRKPSDAK